MDDEKELTHVYAKVLEKICKDHQKVPERFGDCHISAYDFVKQKAMNIGISFLQKPFSIEQLAECLDNLKIEDALNLS